MKDLPKLIAEDRASDIVDQTIAIAEEAYEQRIAEMKSKLYKEESEDDSDESDESTDEKDDEGEDDSDKE